MKKILAIAFVLIMVIGLVGCNQTPATDAPTAPDAGTETPQEGTKDKAAFIAQSLANESQAYSWKMFQQYCDEYGFEMDVFEGNNDVQNEAKAVTNCIAQGYKAIFVDPSDINAIVPSLQEAIEAGVIVGMFSSDVAEDVADSASTFFVGVDDTMAGETAGKAFMEHFPDGAKIVEVGGQSGHDAQIKRKDGFLKATEGSKIEVLDSQNCSGWITADALAIMEDFIVKYGDQIQGVYCHWDNGATGVIQALESAGMEGVYVAGVDGCRAGFDQVKAGTQQLCISQSFEQMVIKSLQNARAAVDGQTVERTNFIPLDAITIDNIDSFPYPEW